MADASSVDMSKVDLSKINIPENIKHIKIDVGLSYGAPMSQVWFSNEPDLFVIGIEPNPDSVSSILDPNNKKRDEGHGTVLESKYFNNIHIIPVALGLENKTVDFYVTKRDQGCSSVYKPKESYDINSIIKVPMIKFENIMSTFPWDRFEYIEYLKIDAQGSDLNIVKSLGSYISKFVYITLEAEHQSYYGSEYNNVNEIHKYMTSNNFSAVQHPDTRDPTYINNNHKDKMNSIYIYQIG